MVAQTHITMVGAFSPKPYNAPIPKCTATNPIFLANSDRGRSHKPRIHPPLNLGDRELRRRGVAHTSVVFVTYGFVAKCRPFRTSNHIFLENRDRGRSHKPRIIDIALRRHGASKKKKKKKKKRWSLHLAYCR